jgi:hypothetical protein
VLTGLGCFVFRPLMKWYRISDTPRLVGVIESYSVFYLHGETDWEESPGVHFAPVIVSFFPDNPHFLQADLPWGGRGWCKHPPHTASRARSKRSARGSAKRIQARS